MTLFAYSTYGLFCYMSTQNWLLYRVKSRGGILPYMGYIGMCGPKGYGFSAVLVIYKASILADLAMASVL